MANSRRLVIRPALRVAALTFFTLVGAASSWADWPPVEFNQKYGWEGYDFYVYRANHEHRIKRGICYDDRKVRWLKRQIAITEDLTVLGKHRSSRDDMVSFLQHELSFQKGLPNCHRSKLHVRLRLPWPHKPSPSAPPG